MIQFPSQAADQYGCRPYLKLKVKWSDASPIRTYTDELLSVSQIDSVVAVFAAAESQSVTVTLDDTDGLHRGMFDTTDFHQRPAWLYQMFEGTSTETLLFKGVVTTPITWKEGTREFSFTILSKVEDAEVGFAAEQGQFTSVPDDVVGKPWPIGFGQVCRGKALKLTTQLVSNTLDPFGIPDPSLYAQIHISEQYPEHYACQTNSHYVTFWNDQAEATTYCADRLQKILTYLGQFKYAVDKIRVENASKFPQNQMVYVKINEKRFHGYFDSTYFYFENGIDLRVYYQQMIDNNWTTATYDSISQVYCFIGCTGDCHTPPHIQHYGVVHPDGLPDLRAKTFGNYFPTAFPGVTTYKGPQPKLSSAQYNDVSTFINVGGGAGQICIRGSKTWELEQIGYFEASAGSTIYLDDDEPIDYVANLVTATDIKVCAKMKVDNATEIFVGVPTDWYTIVYLNLGAYVSTLIRLKKPLVRYDSRFSGEDLYVSYQSEVDGNIVTIIKWLLDTYSTLTYDNTTFNAVQTKVDAYKAGFTIDNKRKLMEIINDIAYQSRCAVFLKNGTYYIRYLSETPTSIAAYTLADDVDLGTLLIEATPTSEELQTKNVISFRDCSEADKEVVLRSNISKYGLHSNDQVYYIFNDVNCVIKSGTYWLIRNSNTWKQYKFTVPITDVIPETFDAITLDGQLMVVKNSNYDTNSFGVELTCWSPVRLGETGTYQFAFPASASPLLQFGTAQPTAGTKINEGYGGSPTTINDSGDLYPSDTGDIPCSIEDPACNTYVPLATAGSTNTINNYAPQTLNESGPSVDPTQGQHDGDGDGTGGNDGDTDGDQTGDCIPFNLIGESDSIAHFFAAYGEARGYLAMNRVYTQVSIVESPINTFRLSLNGSTAGNPALFFSNCCGDAQKTVTFNWYDVRSDPYHFSPGSVSLTTSHIDNTHAVAQVSYSVTGVP